MNSGFRVKQKDDLLKVDRLKAGGIRPGALNLKTETRKNGLNSLAGPVSALKTTVAIVLSAFSSQFSVFSSRRAFRAPVR